jgi:hypothetical protein
MAETAAGSTPADDVERARTEVRNEFLKHATLEGEGAKPAFDRVYRSTLGNYLTCPKADGSGKQYWREDPEFREFMHDITRRIAKRLAKGNPGATPSGPEIERVAADLMRGVHDEKPRGEGTTG